MLTGSTTIRRGGGPRSLSVEGRAYSGKIKRGTFIHRPHRVAGEAQLHHSFAVVIVEDQLAMLHLRMRRLHQSLTIFVNHFDMRAARHSYIAHTLLEPLRHQQTILGMDDANHNGHNRTSLPAYQQTRNFGHSANKRLIVAAKGGRNTLKYLHV